MEFPLNIRQVTGRTVSDGSVDQAVPFLEKFFFYSGEGLDGTDHVKWVKWVDDCNGHPGEDLYGTDSKLMAEINRDAFGEILSDITHPSIDGSYTPATFVDRLSGGPLKTCYSFFNEPYMTYWDMPVTVVGISEIRSVGSPSVLALDYNKEFQFVGMGVSDGDQAYWVTDDAQDDLDCTADSPLRIDLSGVVNSDGKATFYSADLSYAGQTYLLCYKFGRESPKIYPEFILSLKTLGSFIATGGSNTTSVAGTRKQFKLVGGQVSPGDSAKWVEGVIDDAGCVGAYAGGILNASLVDEDYKVEFDFSSPSPANSFFSLCYSFGSEPFKLFSGLVTQVTQINTAVGMNETHAIVNSPQPVAFVGTGITEADTVKFVTSSQSCNDDDAFGAGSAAYRVKVRVCEELKDEGGEAISNATNNSFFVAGFGRHGDLHLCRGGHGPLLQVRHRALLSFRRLQAHLPRTRGLSHDSEQRSRWAGEAREAGRDVRCLHVRLRQVRSQHRY